uniref:Uncharacterized protein n=1 Tax=Tanacetum cinerariifolium TaxID=118510 RepID=A0A6L2L4K8_TANCI|nr:hypothetical protein [Tanacetum cinerariifolium]
MTLKHGVLYLGYQAAMIRLRDEAASTSSPPLQLPSTSRREDRPEVTLPPRKRLDIALGPRYEVGESSFVATARPAGAFAMMCKAYSGEPSIKLLRSFLILGRTGDWLTLSSRGGADVPKALTKLVTHLEEWKEMDFRSFMIQRVDDSYNISADKGKLSLIGPDAPSYLKEGKRSTVTGKGKVVVGSHGEEFPSSKELKDATDCHWVVAHVTPLSWTQYLRGISIEQLCDIHDKAYMNQAVLDNVLNGRTLELISASHKAKASCDTMREREVKKAKAYVELEKKRNKALQDLDKNLLVSDMCAEIKTLQSRVNGLYTMKLIYSDEIGVLIARLVKASIIYGRCSIFEEVAELKKPFVLEEMPGYRPSSKKEYDQAGNDLADASYPFLAELTADPYASIEPYCKGFGAFACPIPILITISKTVLRHSKLFEGFKYSWENISFKLEVEAFEPEGRNPRTAALCCPPYRNGTPN